MVEAFLDDHPKYHLVHTEYYSNSGKSYYLSDETDMVVLDDHICDYADNEKTFPYTQITDVQNKYVHHYRRLLRFLGYHRELVDSFLNINFSDTLSDVQPKTVADRETIAEPSPLELRFEDEFTSVYGMKALKYLHREYCINDHDGKNYFLDYYINTKTGKMAIEENGIHYHHPQLIGPEKYKLQLRKQNACSLWGIKLFRFSTEDLKFDNRIGDDIKQYIGPNTDGFVENGIPIDRQFKLYEHQEISLHDIQDTRRNGVKSFLLVLPTASGKSLVVEQDMFKFLDENKNRRALILVPGARTVADWKERVASHLTEQSTRIDVLTYALMERRFTEYDSRAFSYIVIDEAHHAVAPVLKRVIQYFDPEFLIGLTATDQRPDKRRLEDIFGSYYAKLSLVEAMKKGIVAKANVYRIETNLDLSHVRFNGKDYSNADLEKSICIDSRNYLIVDVIKEYFSQGTAGERQGIVFCVDVKHANKMASLLKDAGIAAASYTGKTKNPDEVIRKFKEHKIRFLCSCQMISEGWDYPELGILVMARPTMSKVLYLQQIGRGLRKTDTKRNVFIIDVVDEYGAMAKACSMHAIFGNAYYVPFGDITKDDYRPGDYVEIDGIRERIEKISEVEIGTFEDKYGNYLSQEQLAREYFVSTGTITSWIRKKKIEPSIEYPFGNRRIYLFHPELVEKYRIALGIKEHNEDTIKEDFFAFIEERDYSLSYKMPFVLGLLNHVNSIGDAVIDDILDDYIAFYMDRVDRGLRVDRATCPYNAETLKDRTSIKASMLTNPFEKFERKRFMYYSKELGVISINHALWEKMDENDWNTVSTQMKKDLDDYFRVLN